MNRVSASLLMSVLVLAATTTSAQDYPTRPIRFVVGFTPGGPADTFARVVGGKLTSSMGQPVVVDNRTGAGGNISAEVVAAARPDGYTLLLATQRALVITPIVPDHKARFNADRDFAPVSKLGESMGVLTAQAASRMSGVQDLIAMAREKPGAINYASSGMGTTHHLAAELLSLMSNIKMTHVPYKGAAAGLPALMGGEVQASFGPIVPAVPHIKAGRIKALGMTGTRRSATMPEIATIAEQGLAGFGANTWYGVYVPAKTPNQ